MTKTIRRGLLVLALTLVIAPLSPGWAGDVLERISKTKTLRVGMSGSQPPFNFTNREGKVVGMEVDLAQLLANSMDVELKIEKMPFSELLGALEKGKVDMVMSGMTATLQRNLRVAFIGPYHVSGKSLLTKSSTVAAITDSQEINRNDLRFAVLAGSTGESFVRKAAPAAKVVATKDYDEAVDLLMQDKVDAFVADAPIVLLTAMRYPDAGFATLKKPLTLEPIGIALPPSDPLLLNLVENYLGTVEAVGGLEALQEKWFKNSGWLMQLP